MNGGLGEATAFLTIVGRGRSPGPAAVRWFPIVGASMGALLGALWLVAHRVWPPGVAAVIVVAADLVLTGMLHVDGLIDSADGLLPHLERARRLDVMTEPGVGAFGIATAVITLLLRTLALATLVPDVRLIAALWCLSRTAMAAGTITLPYARADGLASAFLDPSPAGRRMTRLWLGLGLAAAIALAASWRAAPGLGAVAAAVVAAGGVAALAVRRLGGFTGDVLGAAGVVAETVGLVVAAARW